MEDLLRPHAGGQGIPRSFLFSDFLISYLDTGLGLSHLWHWALNNIKQQNNWTEARPCGWTPEWESSRERQSPSWGQQLALGIYGQRACRNQSLALPQCPASPARPVMPDYVESDCEGQ